MFHRTLTAAAIAVAATGATPAAAFEGDAYRSLVIETVLAIDSGDFDVAHLISVQDQLIAIAIDGARDFGERNPEHARLMAFLVQEAPGMRSMTLDEIEEAWHEGEALSQIGIDFASLDQVGPAYAHFDTVVDPMSAHIALRLYQETGEEEYLELVVEELTEVLDQVEMLE